jgi:hypothetical protein
MTSTYRPLVMSAIGVGAGLVFALIGFAMGAHYQFRHTVFLNGAIVARDIQSAKICTQQGCDTLRAWLSTDIQLQLTNYSLQYAVLSEPFPRGAIDVVRYTWQTRHVVDNVIKSPKEFERAISECNCGLKLESAVQ